MHSNSQAVAGHEPADISLRLPLKLQVVRPLGKDRTLDLRLNLASIDFSWPRTRHGADENRSLNQSGWPYTAIELANAIGGILCCHLLAPSFTANLQASLLKPSLAAHVALLASSWHERRPKKIQGSHEKEVIGESRGIKVMKSASQLLLRISGASLALSSLSAELSLALPSASKLAAASMALVTVCLEERRLASDLRSVTLDRPSKRRRRGLHHRSGYRGSDLNKLQSVSWQMHHRRSGLRVAKLLGSLPKMTSPPLEGVVWFLSSLSISSQKGVSLSFPSFFRPDCTMDTLNCEEGAQSPSSSSSSTCSSSCPVSHISTSTCSSSSPVSHISSSSCTSAHNNNRGNRPFHQAAMALGLPLYGRLDHAHPSINKMDGESFLSVIILVMRGLFLMACFAPFLLLGLPLILTSLWISSLSKERERIVSSIRSLAWRLLLFGCRMTGAATIKWAQWAATRGDLFDPDFCSIMSSLHEAAPSHTFAHTRRTVEAAVQCPLSKAFVTFDPIPLASASIAQVHRATLAVGPLYDQIKEVVVKVRHPNVAEHIKLDFEIFKLLASLISGWKVFKGLPIKESISMFSSTMTAQTDFRVEAAHLERFYSNFFNSSITTPKPIWASEAVLIETFEQGQSVAKFMGKGGQYNAEIVSLGVECYLSMLLRDRFVHQDLHPGNIMARVPDCEGKATELILLDFGLAEELSGEVQHRFVAFLSSICSGDGDEATNVLLSWTSQKQECPNPDALRYDMVQLFEVECDRRPGSKGVDLDKVMKSILKLARKHEVTIDSCYAALVISVCVIVGFATSLDPEVNVIDAATSCILAWKLTGKVMGKLYG